jgi:anaerobic magnesium-protoporphyrin IX monomethyl ester cyclase
LKITLINPRIPLENIILHPPLGIGYIAMMLKKSNHDVNIIDMPILNLSYDDLKKEIAKQKPDLIGISTMTKTFAEGVMAADACKEVYPKVPVVMGGPHVTFKPEETLERQKSIDIIVIYEGEYTMPELAEAIEKNKNLDDIEGIAFRKNRKIFKTKIREPIKNLDALPYPNRNLFPIKLYMEKDDETTLITARGCPYRCKFCSTTIMGRYLRLRSIENVMPEVDHVLSLGFKSIFISDDTFTYNKERVIKMCKEFIRNKFDFRWTCNMRIDNAWEDMLKWMKKAGCYRVFIGAESSATSVLENINKKITQNQTIDSVKKIQKAGIEVHASFALGMPGETPETIRQTVNFAKKLKPGMISFNILTPYPGTEIYEQPEKNGIIMPDKLWYEKRNWPYNLITGTKRITPQRLRKLVKEAYISYCS